MSCVPATAAQSKSSRGTLSHPIYPCLHCLQELSETGWGSRAWFNKGWSWHLYLVICGILYPKHLVVPFQQNADWLPPCMTYLEGLRLLSCNAKRCRNALHENSMMPSSYLTYKLFQSLPGGKAKGQLGCFITHACCHDKESQKYRKEVVLI